MSFVRFAAHTHSLRVEPELMYVFVLPHVYFQAHMLPAEKTQNKNSYSWQT